MKPVRTPARPTVSADQRLQVALVVETSVIYGRQILKGVARYLRTQGNRSVFLEERELGASPPQWLSQWQGNGVICRSTTPEWAGIFRRLHLAAVDLNDLYLDLGLPRVASDMHRIGQAGAEHLCERGFHRLAFCGFSRETWSEQRCAGFVAAASGRATIEGIYRSPWAGLRRHSWQQERDQVAEWISKLPRPLGIMACNDVRAQHVLDACRHIGVRVPDEIAVVGVDNAETFCELCDPPLSSVMPNAERIGFEAAALLDHLMTGGKAPKEEVLVEPFGVVTRQSTDAVAVEDPTVSRAMRFIRDHACQGIKVSDVLDNVGCSRSILERRFRAHFGQSPQAEMRGVRIRRAQQLLSETDWSLPRIAEAVGIDHPEYLSVLFKRQTGQTPGQFRRAFSGEKNLKVLDN